MGEWLNPPDCKSGRYAYAGSNPAPSTIRNRFGAAEEIDPVDQFQVENAAVAASVQETDILLPAQGNCARKMVKRV